MVYKGKERATGREVAMKIVRAQDQIEFDDGSGGCPDDAYRYVEQNCCGVAIVNDLMCSF